jgi:endogenous inhibitor of DNA gyrase (YacG/DUF329 family)
MIIKCSRCGTETTFEGNPFRPFCSERCKQIDLGRWIDESYRISKKNDEEEEDGAPSPGKDSEA